MTGEEAFLEAFVAHPGAVLFGVGFIILCVYFGMSILFDGWPERKK